MQRIALLTPTFHSYSGIDRVVEDQAKRFIERGDQVTIFYLEGSIDVPGANKIQLGMPTSPLWQRIYRLLFFLDVPKIIRTVRALREYDLVYCHFYPMSIVALMAKRFYGKTYWYHNYGIPPGEVFPSAIEKVYLAVFRWCANRTMRTADRVISISHFLSNELLRETGRASDVEYIAIDRHLYHRGIDRKKIRFQYRLNDAPLILFVGRVSPHKGVEFLLSAFQQLRQTVPNARLMIVGKQTFKKYIERLIAAADHHVSFIGFVPDEELPYYYAAADVYATASLWEGYDMPIAEAQACGTRVVAFDIGPHKEIIDDRGILVPPRNTQAFCKALAQILAPKVQ